MKTRVVGSAIAALALLSLSGLAAASDTFNTRRSQVQTFRNDHVTPAMRGRSVVGSFTRTASNVAGGVGKSAVKSVKRRDNTVGERGKSMVLTVSRRGGDKLESSVVTVSGERERLPRP